MKKMKKRIISIILVVIVVMAALYFSIKVMGPPKDQSIKLELLIDSSKSTFSHNGSINITCSIVNKGNGDVEISGKVSTPGGYNIYDNGALSFKIRDSKGNLILREGEGHGLNGPLVLSPGERLTVIADLNRYFPLDNITGPITVQAMYGCGPLDENNGIPAFNGTLESNVITIILTP